LTSSQRVVRHDVVLLTAPGAEKLIRHLHAHGVPMALATGSSQPKMKCKTANHEELFSLFQHAVFGTGDPEVTRPKPAPDSYIVCAARFKSGGAKPENVSRGNWPCIARCAFLHSPSHDVQIVRTHPLLTVGVVSPVAWRGSLCVLDCLLCLHHVPLCQFPRRINARMFEA